MKEMTQLRTDALALIESIQFATTYDELRKRHVLLQFLTIRHDNALDPLSLLSLLIATRGKRARRSWNCSYS